MRSVSGVPRAPQFEVYIRRHCTSYSRGFGSKLLRDILLESGLVDLRSLLTSFYKPPWALPPVSVKVWSARRYDRAACLLLSSAKDLPREGEWMGRRPAAYGLPPRHLLCFLT